MILLQIIDYRNSKLDINFGSNLRAKVGNNGEEGAEFDNDLENGSSRDPFDESQRLGLLSSDRSKKGKLSNSQLTGDGRRLSERERRRLRILSNDESE
jgi:hypothetical protein